jgi:hypothetical protein
MLKLGLSLGAELGILLILGDVGWLVDDTDAWSRTGAEVKLLIRARAQSFARHTRGCTCAKLGALLMIEMSSVSAGSNTHIKWRTRARRLAPLHSGCTGRKA